MEVLVLVVFVADDGAAASAMYYSVLWKAYLLISDWHEMQNKLHMLGTHVFILHPRVW